MHPPSFYAISHLYTTTIGLVAECWASPETIGGLAVVTQTCNNKMGPHAYNLLTLSYLP